MRLEWICSDLGQPYDGTSDMGSPEKTGEDRELGRVESPRPGSQRRCEWARLRTGMTWLPGAQFFTCCRVARGRRSAAGPEMVRTICGYWSGLKSDDRSQ
jgi:hypothetical protein